jgi:hypothetical protein
MLVHVAPASVEICHCTVGAGVPLAAAVNVAVAPLQILLWFVGCVVTAGVVFTVSVAAVVFVEPQLFVKTARY